MYCVQVVKQGALLEVGGGGGGEGGVARGGIFANHDRPPFTNATCVSTFTTAICVSIKEGQVKKQLF